MQWISNAYLCASSLPLRAPYGKSGGDSVRREQDAEYGGVPPWESQLASSPFMLVVNGCPIAESEPIGHPIRQRIERGAPWQFRDGVVLMIWGRMHLVSR